MAKFIPYNQRKYFPLGPKSAEVIKRADKFSAKNYESYPFVVKKSHGPWLYDVDGNKALDFLSAYSSVLKHRNWNVILPVIKEMIFGTCLTSRAVYNWKYDKFVEKVHELTGYEQLIPKSDGGTAADAAISGMLMHGGSRGYKTPEVILTTDYFHGRTWIFGSNALFDKDQSKNRVPRAQGVVVVENNYKAIEQAITKDTVGIFIETHKGEGGPLFSTKEDFMKIKQIVNKGNKRGEKIFLGCDEIQTGLGRCGHMMAWQEFGEQARPDCVTLGKALGGGVIPVSALIGNKEFMDIFISGSDGSTHGGYSLASVAACASLDYIVKKRISEKAKNIGDYFVQKLNQTKSICAENKGALIRVELKGIKTAKHACLEMLLGKNINPRVFMKHGHYDAEKDIAYTRIAPPIAAMTKELIDKALDKTIIPVLTKATR